MIEAGADPYGYPRRRSRGERSQPCSTSPSRFRSRQPGRALCAAWPRGTSSSAAVPGNTKAGSDRSTRRSRYLSRGRFSKKLFEADCLREYAETFPDGLRRFRVLPISRPTISGSKLFAAGAGGFPLRLQSAGADHLQGLPGARRATGRRRARRTSHFWTPALFQRDVPAPAAAAIATETALLIFEFGHFSKRSFRRTRGVSGAAGSLPGAIAAGVPLRVEIRNPEFLERDYFACLRNHRVAHVYNAWSDAGTARADRDSGFGDGGFPGLPRAAAARAVLRGGGQLFSPYTEVKDPNPEDARRVARPDPRGERTQSVPVPVRQ